MPSYEFKAKIVAHNRIIRYKQYISTGINLSRTSKNIVEVKYGANNAQPMYKVAIMHVLSF